MGCGSSMQAAQQNHPQYNPVASNRFKKLAGLIEDRFSVIKRFQSELIDLTYTEGSLIQFIQVFIKCIGKIGDGQSNEEKTIVKGLFSLSTILDIRQDKKFFGDLLKQLKESKKGQINEANKSRIYHEIANIKKETKVEKNIQKNKFGLEVQKTYEYNTLSDEQMNEVVKLQLLGSQIQKLGQTIQFKLHSARKQTESITLLLGHTFAKYADCISNFKYDLNIQEVMMIAKIAREACDHYENGVYFLVVYFVVSCNHLQKGNKKVPQIQEKLNAAISQISKKYPPGEGLSQKDLQFKEHLQKIELKKQPFSKQPQILKPNQKQQQLESIIKHQAGIAKQCKPLFQTLVKNTCLEDSLSFKLGLKYNNDSPNPKAITRIIEKMLFKNDKDGKTKQNAKMIKNIDEQLNKEDQDYRNKIQQKLQNQQSVLFTISDMVRGKCIFNQIEDIIQTVHKIKKYVDQNADSYRMIEIQSRFNNKIPISDVTLKIAIEQKTVAELQLTLQTNAATYTFAHKIYEFARSKVFSKIKVIDNYHKQFQSQFTSMVGQRVWLAETNKQNSSKNELNQNIKKCGSKIRKYFDMKADMKRKSFGQLLQNELFRTQSQLKEGQLWDNEQLQDLILPIFCIKIGEWGLQLGNKINNIVLKQNRSSVFKSTLIYFLCSHIDGEQHFQTIRQFQNKRKRQLMQQQLKSSIYTQQKINFQEYVKDSFEIIGVNKYHNCNAKLFYKFKDLSAIIDFYYDHQKIQHKYLVQIDRVFGEDSDNTVHSFFNFAKICFLRKQYSPFQAICKWSMNIIQKIYIKEARRKVQNIALIQLLMAQNYLQQNKTSDAMKLLIKNAKVFQQKQDYKREIDCDLMLVQCKLKQQAKVNIQEYKKAYSKVLEKVKVKGITLRGRTVADSEWRIAQKCMQIAKVAKNTDMQRQTIDQHYRRVMNLYSAYNVQKCVIVSNTIPWSEFKKYNLPNPQMKENKITLVLDLKERQIGKETCQTLIEANIHNLNQLFLDENKIGSQGCRLLSKANWPNLRLLNLYLNQIGDEGCQYLIKANWINLSQLNLHNNSIESQGCKYLSTANWPNLTSLNLNSNIIGIQGCRHLSSANWASLTKLYLYNDSIGDQGCKQLCKSNWPNLNHLDLNSNSIWAEGCQYLISTNWPSLKTFNLGNNSIEDEGCLYLSRTKWPNLTGLYLSGTKIKKDGCQNLRKANWPNLNEIGLCYNNLSTQDVEILKNAVWNLSIAIEY